MTEVTKKRHIPMLALLAFLFSLLSGGCIVLDDNHGHETKAYLQVEFSPSYVYPAYDQAYHEWRWYFDINLYETNGTAMTIDELTISFYTLDGVHITTGDYSDRIYSWFGTDWLPAHGMISCPGTYWTNSNSSPYGWSAYFTFGGVDANGNWVDAGAEVICADGSQNANLECSFSINPVTPYYDYTYGEWRWYVDWSVYETNGIDVSLRSVIIDFYDLSDHYLYSEDFSHLIYDWFGTDRLAGNGKLTCYGLYWVNTDGSGYGTRMQYNYEGIDAYGATVRSSCWLTLDSAYQSSANEEADPDRVLMIQKGSIPVDR